MTVAEVINRKVTMVELNAATDKGNGQEISEIRWAGHSSGSVSRCPAANVRCCYSYDPGSPKCSECYFRNRIGK